MAGQTARILPRTDYTMTNLTVPNGTTTVTIARKLDTSMWREGVVVARLHQVTWPAGATISLLLAPDGYTDEDPGQIWNFSTSTLLTFSQAGDTAPSAKNAEFPTPFGPLAQLQLKFTMAGNAGAFTPSLSVDLNLKGQ